MLRKQPAAVSRGGRERITLTVTVRRWSRDRRTVNNACDDAYSKSAEFRLEHLRRATVDKILWRPYSIVVKFDHIRQRLSGGFRPFLLLTSDGREYAVRHPEFVMVGPRSLAVVDDNGIIVTFDPLHIVAIKDMPRKRNGASKR